MTSLEGHDEFSNPAEAVGFNWEEHKDALLIIEPTSVESDIETSFGTKDAVRARISVVDGPHAGDVYEDTLVFPRALIGQLRSNVGKKVLGRLGQGAAKKGQKPPWKLQDASPEEITAAKRFLSGGGNATAGATSPAAPPAPKPEAPSGTTAPAGIDASALAGLDPEALAALQEVLNQKSQ